MLAPFAQGADNFIHRINKMYSNYICTTVHFIRWLMMMMMMKMSWTNRQQTCPFYIISAGK